jgi:hypothetical protein
VSTGGEKTGLKNNLSLGGGRKDWACPEETLWNEKASKRIQQITFLIVYIRKV